MATATRAAAPAKQSANGDTSMIESRNDIPKAKRTKLCTLLNERLRDSIKLGLNAKQAHWNVKGLNFIALHKLFDEVHAATEEFVDEIAERVTALGGLADGSVSALGKSEIGDHPTKAVDWKTHVNSLADELAAYGKLVRQGIDEADELEDKGTADLFTGISRKVDQYLWFVEAHVQD
ncbi:DNA starvation/stationary phase protection protein Dps [Anatilimnocola floriformis]|uniref:DNA starvation/stationary phase protection protein Dps n=1 Tax=Anatilimnocola floriformis TaxID=2948575 RepID=UPI0020C1EC04|nr:DNA starvation/stationary phase protection protein Dps [Anatilimnocola floriformis]